ncbi:MAG: flavin reductase family protein [Pseudomonadota bacterium]
MNNTALSMLDNEVDPSQLRRTFACFPSGVAAVCAHRDDGPIGLLVSSFTSVSLDPPLVSMCIMNGSRRWSLLRDAPRLGLSFLGDSQQQECKQLAGPLEQGFDGLEFRSTPEGAVLLHDTTAWLDCSLYEEIPAGDHVIALLRIEGLEPRPTQAPLVFHNSQFHRLAAL